MFSRSLLSLLVMASFPTAFAGNNIDGLIGSYTSLVKQGSTYQYFAEQQKSGSRTCGDNKHFCPGISLYTGSKEKDVKLKKLIIPNSLITDHPNALITRNGVAYSKKFKKYYAVAHVSSGYPPTDGKVIPAFFESETSDPQGKWIYRGKFNNVTKGWLSGTSLIVNDDYNGGAIDHVNPLKNKFIHYSERNSIELIYSNDGKEWFSYKKDNKIVSLRPSQYSSDPKWIFPSVVKTKYGYFMWASLGWYPTGHRFLFSKDGLSWKQIGFEKAGPKNISLSYDWDTDMVYEMITDDGSKHGKSLRKYTAKSKSPAGAVVSTPSVQPTPTPAPSLPAPSKRLPLAKYGAGRKVLD